MKTSQEMALLMLYDKRMGRAGKRLGLTPYLVDYWYLHDAQITQLLPFVGVPGDYHYWNKGKEAEGTGRAATVGTSMKWC